MAKHVLVVGAELLTRFLDFDDRGTCILFGDGAGAVVLSASDEPGGGMSGLELTTDPDGAYMIWLPSGGSRSPSSSGDHQARRALHPHGRAVRPTATPRVPWRRPRWRPSRRPAGVLTRSTWSSRTRPTYASSRPWPRACKLPMERFFVNIDKLRQHLGRVRGHRPGRGRSCKVASSPATRSSSWPSVPASPRVPSPWNGPLTRPPVTRAASVEPGGQRALRLWTGHRSTRCRRASRPCSTTPPDRRSPLDDVVPGEPAHAHIARSSPDDRPHRQERRHHRGRAWHRPCRRPSVSRSLGAGCLPSATAGNTEAAAADGR